MIVILCNSWQDAKDAYDCFIDFLERCVSYCIRKTYNSSCCIETDDDLRYIFVDHRFKNLFYKIDKPDTLDVVEFFEGIEDFYGL